MLKILSKVFPLIDHLYIYQILEYSSLDFLNWFVKNPMKRDLQKKHKIKWTSKARLLFSVSLFLIIIDSLFNSLYFFDKVWPIIFFLPLKTFFSPLFLIASQVLIRPFEYFQKQKIINMAKEKLQKLPNLKVIAITGSFGKTSTKDILYTLLFKKYFVVKTPKSYNTPLGIAKTILQLVKKNTDIFICEVGAYKIGEIKKIARLINPQMGIITAVAPQHFERFGSLENIAKAKFELAENLKKDGVAILNGNYDLLKNLALHLSGVNVKFYGNERTEYYATKIRTGTDGTNFIIHTPKGGSDIEIPLIGEHHAINFLAATVASVELELSLSEIKERAKLLLPTPHRLEIRKTGNITFIDNSYNINPDSTNESLKLLSSFKDARKIIITTGFVELGIKGKESNIRLGEEIACLADEVIIVGEKNKGDLLTGIKMAGTEEFAYFVASTKEALTLAYQLANEMIQSIARHDTKVIILLEGDLPDQYF